MFICVIVLFFLSRSFFFFFQAEDGIRDWSVTGVQTCALPICCDMAAKLKKGDKVVVLSGKDKGKEGTIASVDPKDRKSVV